MRTARVATVLLTMNQRRRTLRCLESLVAAGISPGNIVLWDNGSQDGTAEAAKETFPGLRVHVEPRNAGVASGRNGAARIAIRERDPEFFFFLDNDMTVAPGFMDFLLDPFARDQSLAIVTGKIKDLGNPDRLYGAGGCRLKLWRGNTRHVGNGELDRGQHDEPKRCIASGGCMLIRRSVFEELGGFDPVFDPYGPEDLDFGLRAVKAGYFALYEPRAVVFHETRPGKTFEGGQYTSLFASNRARHWLLLMRRHAPFWQRLAFLSVGAPYLLARLLVREARRGNLVPTLRGLGRGVADHLRDLLKRQGRR